MSHEQTTLSATRWVGWSALALALITFGCGGEVSGTAPTGTATDTHIDGEQFSSLEVSADRLNGVFVKDSRSLAFDVDHRNGSAAFTLSSTSGETLYSIIKGPTGTETHVGSTYRSMLPRPAGQGPGSPNNRNFSTAKFESTGNLKEALDGLKGTPIDLLPYLAAALGRIGIDGSRAPIALPVHMTAMHLTKVLGLEFDNRVREATNRIIEATASQGSSPQTPTPPALAPSQPDAGGSPLSPTGTLHTEGFQNPPPAGTCPASGNKPPCLAGQTLLTTGIYAGCCFTPPPPPPVVPPDYSATASCSSGAAREVFYDMTQDPCRDDCLGLCGPGCKDPWDWICGDERVHAACWNHDSAYCPTSFHIWGVDVPNPDYPLCEVEYFAYSAEIGTDTVLGPLCANDWATDLLTRPWPGLWTIVPGYEVTYQNVPPATMQSPPAENYYCSSVLPGYDSWAHGPAQAGDHKRLPGSSWRVPGPIDGNFFDSATFHSDSGYTGWAGPGAPSGQYWYVDLGAPKNITRIMIYNRTDYANYANGRLTNFQALIWDSTNWTWIPIADDSTFGVAPAGSGTDYPLGTDGSMQDFNPQVGTNSQYVMIAKTDADYLVLGDVVIWAY